MTVQSISRAGRPLMFGFTVPCYLAGLVLAALLFLPAESPAQINGCVNGSNCTCTTANPNPNPNPAVFAAAGDFNADCKSDVLWRNSGTGQDYIWLMNGTASASQGSPGSASSVWVMQGVGDFNGDGMSDILWRNSTTGEVYVWFMNGTATASQASLGTVTTDWSIEGVGDFNGDGKSDILWQNSSTGQVYIWLMNGTTTSSQASPGTVAPATGWMIAGVGDFNGDGKADILWQNSSTGQLYVWLMNGTATASEGSPGSVTPSIGWSIAGVGDFNGDGKSDILWQNSSSGQLYIWFMNGTSLSSVTAAGSVPSPTSTTCCSGVGNGWSILGVGDYDGSGRAGILWEQFNTGQLYVWLMNGTTPTSEASPGTVGLTWQVASLAPNNCSDQVLCNILAESNNVRANGSFGPGNPAPSSTTGGPLNALVWDPGAATNARTWATQCNFSHNTNLNTLGYGENIFASTGSVTGTDVADNWASEAANYTYSTNSCAAGQSCGHYTQLVWRTTNGVGCAVQACTTGSPFGGGNWTFAVCDFSPAGNWGGVSPY